MRNKKKAPGYFNPVSSSVFRWGGDAPSQHSQLQKRSSLHIEQPSRKQGKKINPEYNHTTFNIIDHQKTETTQYLDFSRKSTSFIDGYRNYVQLYGREKETTTDRSYKGGMQQKIKCYQQLMIKDYKNNQSKFLQNEKKRHRKADFYKILDINLNSQPKKNINLQVTPKKQISKRVMGSAQTNY